jgi:succinate dehydrogenase / fumarate reductase membrane anchor subunit
MVKNILSLSSNGLRDWLIQRVTAVILLIYTFFILGFIILHPQLQYDEWQMLFSNNSVKIFSLLVLVSILLHAWIGMWTVFTDYIKSPYIRLILLILVAILFFWCLSYGVIVLWGI